MKTKFVDCFLLMGTALSLRGDQRLPAMGRPILQDVFTTNVNVSITISDIYFKNIKNMEVEFTFLLHQRWIDPRLSANQQTKKLAVNAQIWRPWITSTRGETRVSANEMTQYWRGISPEGSVLYSENVIIKTLCTTNFKKFPFDTQKCLIKLGSYRFPKEEVDLFWNTVIPVDVLTGDNFNEFRLATIITYSEVAIRPSGNFTVLVVEITIQRFYEHYIFCTIIPCIFIVFISYFNFWLKLENMNIRYCLTGINLCILLYFYHSSVCSTIPVRYMKALDLFISICITFIFTGLLENFIIDIFFRKENFENYGSRFHLVKTISYNERYKYIDRTACIIYPVLFICILFFYCITYL